MSVLFSLVIFVKVYERQFKVLKLLFCTFVSIRFFVRSDLQLAGFLSIVLL